MAKKRTPAEFAACFFKRVPLSDEQKCNSFNTEHNQKRLQSFWNNWLTECYGGIHDSNYVTLYRLVCASQDTDLFSEFKKLKTVKINTFDHYQILFGLINGTAKYNSRSTNLQKHHSATSRVERFLKSKSVKLKLLNIAISDEIQNELLSLFSHSPSISKDDYANICDFVIYFAPDFVSRYRIIKSNSHNSIEYYRAKYGSQAEEKLAANKEKNSAHARTNFKNCVEYWIARGLDLSDAYDNVKKEQGRRNALAVQAMHGKPRCRSPEFWISQGYSIEDAIARVKLIQSRDLSFFLHKYGEEEGLFKFTEMIESRKNTYYSKDEETRAAIGKSRGRTREQLIAEHGTEYAIKVIQARTSGQAAISKESMAFFSQLDKLLAPELAAESVTGYKGPERWIMQDKKFYFVDYLIENCIIEYNGSFWHADPRQFVAEQIHPVTQLTAKEMWQKDADRTKVFTDLGYKVLTIWSKDVAHNITDELTKCKEFINEHTKLHPTNS